MNIISMHGSREGLNGGPGTEDQGPRTGNPVILDLGVPGVMYSSAWEAINPHIECQAPQFCSALQNTLLVQQLFFLTVNSADEKQETKLLWTIKCHWVTSCTIFITICKNSLPSPHHYSYPVVDAMWSIDAGAQLPKHNSKTQYSLTCHTLVFLCGGRDGYNIAGSHGYVKSLVLGPMQKSTLS